MKDYIEQAYRTCTHDHSEISQRVSSVYILDLLHAGLGISTEAGEFLDTLKKHIYYGKSLDSINLMEEIGDLLWYVALACKTLNISLDEVMEKNIAKLKARYPEKFTSEKAINRDLESERFILENFAKSRKGL